MAFGQTSTGFKVGIGTNPFSTGFNSSFSTPIPTNSGNTATTTTQKRNNNTYNPRYPGFDEEDYKKLEKMVADKGIVGKEKTQIMDELYQIYYPQVLNKHKLDERQQEINNSVYKNGELLLDGNKEANMGIKLTQLSQQAKEKFGIPYNKSDNEVIDAMVKGIPNGSQLLYDYIYNGNPEILYQAGIQDRPQQVETPETTQGGRYGLINPSNEGILPDSNWEWLNPIGAVTETVDNAATKFAEKLTVSGEGAAQNLADRINNMSQEEVEAYRKQYKEMLKDKDWKTARVEGDTIVEQLWNGIKGNLNYDYNDEDFMEWLVSQKANLGESLIGADDILQGEKNPNVVQFFGNIPSSAVKTFTATVRGMTNPVDTMKGLYKLAATEEGHQALLNRYGSWDALANAMNTDPVGVADDVLAVAELGTNIAKGGLKATGKITGNQNLANMANNIPTIGSANDALAQKTIGGIYGGLDNATKWANDKSSTFGTVANGINRYVQDTSSMSKLTNDVKEGAVAAKEGLTNLKDNIVEGAAERLSGAKTSQDKLFQAQEPTLNRLSKERNTKQIRNKADVANELVVKDIKENGGQLPTDTQSRVDAHERAMKNKWNEIETQIKDKGSYTISAEKLADALDDYIKKEESYGVPTSKGDLDKLKERSTDLRKRGNIDIVTAEGVKERINAQINDRDDKSVGNTYKNGMRKLTQEIGKAEDGALSRLPGEFQDLKNEFGALADGYGDVIKANVKAQRAKFGDSLSNFSRIKGVGEIIKGIWNGDLGEVGKGTAQAIGGEITQKIRDKDWLIEQGFKDLSAEMDAPGFKTAFQSRVGKPKGESKITSKQQKGTDKTVKNMKNKK